MDQVTVRVQCADVNSAETDVRFRSGMAAGAATAAALAASAAVAVPALAATHKPGSSCAISPNPAAVNATYVVSAVGLPTGTAVNLFVTAPDGSTTGSPLGSTPDGTFNLNESSSTPGSWTYQFTGPTKHNTVVYGTCSVTVTGQ